MKIHPIDTLKIVVIGSILAVSVSYASTWVAPSTTPTGGNPDAPINVGSTGQIKAGGLTVGTNYPLSLGFDVANGISLFNLISTSTTSKLCYYFYCRF